MAALQMTTTGISIVVPTQTWLTNSGQSPGQTIITFNTDQYPCPTIIQTGIPGLLTAGPTGQPLALPTSAYLLTAGSAGTDIPYSCAYYIGVTHSLDLASRLPTLTADSTLSKTSEPKATPTETDPIHSTAALSGIGIGAFLVGILLGLTLAGCWLCSGRRSDKNNRMAPGLEERSAMLLSAPSVPPPKDPTATSPSSRAQSSPRVTPISVAAAIPQESSLGRSDVLHSLQGANDAQIAKDLEYMGDMIEEHVKNNYHLKYVDISHEMLKESMGELYLDEVMRDQIAALAMEPHTRHASIRHFLALSIFSALDVHYAHGVSLLPPGVSAFMKSLPRDKPDDYRYSTTVLDTWRRASAHLLNSNTNKSTPLSPQTIANAQMKTFHAAANRFLSHFVHEDSRAVFDQTKNLEGVIYECVVFGYTIFSHSCLWRYTYVRHYPPKSSDLEKTSLLVLPGLQKLTGPGGEVLGDPEVLANPTLVSV